MQSKDSEKSEEFEDIVNQCNTIKVIKEIKKHETMMNDVIETLHDDKQVCTRNHTDHVEMAKCPIEIYNVEEKKTEKVKINTGAPKSVAGIGWIRQYCTDADVDFDNLNKVITGDIFILGNDEFR